MMLLDGWNLIRLNNGKVVYTYDGAASAALGTCSSETDQDDDEDGRCWRCIHDDLLDSQSTANGEHGNVCF